MTTQEEPFCGELLLKLSTYYAHNIAGYADISIRITGSILNLFNLLVFTRKNMISPASLIFTHLTFVDLIMLLIGIPSSWHFYVRKNRSFVDEKWAYEWLTFFLYCTDFMIMSHSISVWLTVMLTIWRYIAVVHPLRESNWCNMKITRYGIIIGYVLCTLLCTPSFFSHNIKTVQKGGRNAYIADITENRVLYTMIFINNGVVFKLIPSLVLMLFSLRLIVTLIASKKHHVKLTSLTEIQQMTRNIKMQQVDRSTKILLAVLALFLIAEVPLGILGLMNVIYGDRIHHKCYHMIGLIFDTVTLINTSITFVVYYSMSQQFRNTFKSLFKRKTSISYRRDTFLRKISGTTITSQI